MADAIDCIDAGDPQRAKALLIAAHQRSEDMIVEKPSGAAIAFKRKKPKPQKPKDPTR